jgi:hypothetical protein
MITWNSIAGTYRWPILAVVIHAHFLVFFFENGIDQLQNGHWTPRLDSI